MARYPEALLAQTFSLASQYAIDIVDSTSTRTTQVNPANATRYFRTIAADGGDATASGATSERNAAEFLDHVRRRLNTSGSNWSVAPATSTDWRPTITYSGTGTGSLTFDAAGVIPTLLGFAGMGGQTLNFAAGQTRTADNQPPWCVYILNRADSTGYQRVHPPGVWRRLPSGRVVGYQLTGSNVRRVPYTFSVTAHPSDVTQQSALAFWGTPLRPSTLSRWRSPPPSSVVSATNTPGAEWSLWDFLDTALGHELGLVVLSTSSTTYDLVQLDPATWENERNVRLTTPNLGTMYDVSEITLNWRESLSL